MSTQASSFNTTPITNLLDFFRSFKKNPIVESVELPGLFRYRSEIPHPWFNGVIISRPPTGNESANIQEQLDYFCSHSVASLTWWVEPGTSVDEWGAQLQPHGFGIAHEPPAMACDLKDLPVKAVRDQPILDVWVVTFIAGMLVNSLVLLAD